MTIDCAVRVSEELSQPDDPLLASKFAIPEPPMFMVPRPRLVGRIPSDGPERITVVTGPAGSGKTQLVASWAHQVPESERVVWISLEEDDDTENMFWTYVLEGFRRAGLTLPSLVAPSAVTTINHSFLVRLAAELADVRRRIVLVLDGVSCLRKPQWAGDLDFVARHAGGRLRLVLVGRWDPPLPLHRYRLAGTLAEIRRRDLRFSRQESVDLLSLHGITLSQVGLASLLEHTEGWAAGLRLFALALKGRDDADAVVGQITGTEATIAEYFTGEVLRTLPAHVRGFLLYTSILDTFTPDLAEALTGRPDAANTLAELERENAFVRSTHDPAAYRYHRLFAELLRARLACEEPELIPQLHQRAARWFSERGQIVEAVSHAVKARDWASTAASVVANYAVGDLLIEGRTGRLGSLLRDLPDDVDCAEAALVTAALALADGEPELCAAHLARAEDLFIAHGCTGSDAMALAGLLVEVRLADACRDVSRIMQATKVAQALFARIPADRLARHPELPMLVLMAKGTAQSWAGDIEAAAETLTEAAGTGAGGTPGWELQRIGSLQHLALIRAHQGRLGAAERLATEALDLADHCGLEPDRRPVGALVALACVAVERYDIEAATRHLRAAAPRGHVPTDRLAATAYGLAKSRRLQARGERRGALQALRDVEAIDGPAAPVWLAREVTLSQARLLIMMGAPDEGLALADALPGPACADVAVVRAAAALARGDPERAALIVGPVTRAAGVRTPVGVDAWLLLATVAVQAADPGRARLALGQALRLAAPECLRRAVYQVWAQLRRGLRDDAELAELYRALAAGDAPVGQLQATSPPDPHQLVIVDPLSKREMEVLVGMAAMLPTEEIAASMYVSVNTVKTHIRSILRKLCASRRNEAVRRARSLGLI
jgi:LuxR family transcriptional regulator, maltose regulon positive regulatory protein